MSSEDRISQPLHVKLEALIHRISNKSLGLELPPTSIWDNQEEEEEEDEEDEELEINRPSARLQRATDRITFMKKMSKITLAANIMNMNSEENKESDA